MHDFINKEISRCCNYPEILTDSGRRVCGKCGADFVATPQSRESEELKSVKALVASERNQARTDLIAELVGKVREEKKNWNDGHLPASQKDNVKGFNTALDRAIEIIESYK